LPPRAEAKQHIHAVRRCKAGCLQRQESEKVDMKRITLTRLVATIVTLLAIGMAAQDATAQESPLPNAQDKNRVVVADEFGCREEKTFALLRDLRTSNKIAYRRLLARATLSGRCTIFEIGDPVRVENQNDPWSCVNRPQREIGRCYWMNARSLNCVGVCNDEEKRLSQQALDAQQKKKR
jgi:hypothetical protein